MTYLHSLARMMRLRPLLLCLLAAILSFGVPAQAATRAAAVAPTIGSFVSIPATINLGQQSTLFWSVSDATSLSIATDSGVAIGTVTGASGSIVVTPKVSTNYVMTAIGAGGTTTSLTVVTVILPPKPVIGSFTGTPTSVVPGAPVTLSWSSTGANTVSLTPGPGTVAAADSITVNPTVATTYTLKATNGGGSVTKTVAIKMIGAPVIGTFKASPASITTGSPTTLSWTTTGTGTLSISPDIGTVTGTSVSVTPAATTTYTLTMTNAAGTVSKTATVTVTAPQPVPPVISAFKAAPTTIAPGASSILSWTVSGAKTLSIAPAPGTVTGTSVSVSPDITTTYTLTAGNDFGSVTKTVKVTVALPKPVISSFTASPTTINAGDSATLSWSVTGADTVSIAPAIGTVTGNSISVTPATTNSYTLTATSAGGTVTSTAFVVVNNPGSSVAHPRIWLTPESVATLRQRAANNDPAWKNLRDECDSLATQGVQFPDGTGPSNNVISGVWEYVYYFDPAVSLALCYQVAKTVDPARAASYGAKEREILLALSDPVHHGVPTTDSGYSIRFYVPALALGYDWIYELLTPAERAQVFFEINRWIASYEAVGFGRNFPQGNYFAGYYFAKAVGTLATEGDNPNFDAMWSDWLNRVHYGMVQPYYTQWLSGGGAPDGWGYGRLETINMIRPLAAAFTAKGLDLIHDPVKPVVFADNHVNWITQFTWPNLKTVNDRGLYYEDDNPFSTDVNWAVEYDGLLHFAHGNNSARMQQFTSDLRTVSGGGADTNWVEFLYWDPAAPKAAYNTDLSYRSGGDGQVAMRSAWTSDAVWGAFQSGPYTGLPDSSEEFFDEGSLVVQRGAVQFVVNATGAIITNSPGTSDATNALWQQMYNEMFTTQTDGVADGRRLFNIYYAKRSSGFFAQDTAGPGETNTTLSRFEEGGNYVLMRGTGLAGMYDDTSPITSWTRNVAYLRPQLFVVYDRTSVDNTNVDDWMAWHVASQPRETTGAVPGTHQFDVLDTRAAYGGNLYRGRVTTVLPAGHNVGIVDVFGAGKVQRMEVRAHAGGAASTTWLTVLDASGSASAAGTAAPLSSAAGNVLAGDVEGTIIVSDAGNSAVLFSRSGSTIAGPVSIVIPAANTQCLIADLAPNSAYTVTTVPSADGNMTLQVVTGGNLTTTANGTLSFGVNAGVVVQAAKIRK